MSIGGGECGNAPNENCNRENPAHGNTPDWKAACSKEAINLSRSGRLSINIAARIGPSHLNRVNLTLRMSLRWFTRLTNGHSKSLKHHAAMQAIFVAWYNFARKHETLGGKSPAMASGLTDKVWSVKELLERASAA